MSRAIVYGDISPNVTDGSSIWLISITENLANIFDEVHLLLKMEAQNRRLLGQLDEIHNVVIHPPALSSGEKELSVSRAAEEIANLVEDLDPSVIVARGMDLCNSLSQVGSIAKRLWSYITDLPFPFDRLSQNGKTRLRRISVNSQRVFAQTEGARSYLETIVPEAAGKTLIMSPMIPTEAFVSLKEKRVWPSQEPLKVVYAGKLAEGWKTLEILQLPQALEKLGIQSQLRIVGDKYNRSRSNPQWLPAMQAELRRAHDDPESGVIWLGGLTRSESLREIAEADIGIGWRTVELEGNVEISTKALEYSAGGTAPLVNKTNDNIQFFGENYPFYVTGDADVKAAADVIASGVHKLSVTRTHIQKTAEAYSFKSAQKRLHRYFQRAGVFNIPTTLPSTGREPRKLLIAAHDFKFLGELIDQLRRDPAYELRFDKWDTLHSHNESESRSLANWADVIFCEWAGPNLTWYSNNLPPGVKLVSRLHGFELRGPWLDKVNFENVETMVFVSDFYREKSIHQLGLEDERAFTIPNMVDLVDFDRTKLANSQFNLGMVGMVPFLKRPDRALNLLEKLLSKDDRYTLFLKGRPPWEYPYEWQKPLQKQAYLEFYNRLSHNNALAQRVVFEPFSPAVASWFRNVGIILSPSDQESFHLSVAEGMASRAVPVVWEREGAKEVFGSDNVVPDVNTAKDIILNISEHDDFINAGQKARSYAQRFDIEPIMRYWKNLLS